MLCDFISRGKKNKEEEEQNKKNQKKREKLMGIKDGQMHFSFRCRTVPTRKKLNLKCSECGAVYPQQAAEEDEDITELHTGPEFKM